MQGDVMHGDVMQGGVMHGDVMHGDVMQGGVMQGDVMHGGVMQGDVMHGDVMHNVEFVSVARSQLSRVKYHRPQSKPALAFVAPISPLQMCSTLVCGVPWRPASLDKLHLCAMAAPFTHYVLPDSCTLQGQQGLAA